MKIGNLEVYGIIYKITNKVNGKVYIGQTISKKGIYGRYIGKGNTIIEKIFNWHKYAIKNRKSGNKHLYNSILKYGMDSFEVVDILDFAFSRTELDVKEKSWIVICDSFHNGYNNTTGGNNCTYCEKSKENMRLVALEMGKASKVYKVDIHTLDVLEKYNSIPEATESVGGKKQVIN